MRRKARNLAVPPVQKINDYQGEMVTSLSGLEYRDVVGFAIVTVKGDGETTSQYNQGTAGVARLLGAVELLRSRICREAQE